MGFVIEGTLILLSHTRLTIISLSIAIILKVVTNSVGLQERENDWQENASFTVPVFWSDVAMVTFWTLLYGCKQDVLSGRRKKIQVVGFVIDVTDHVATSYQINPNLPFKYNNILLSTLAILKNNTAISFCDNHTTILKAVGKFVAYQGKKNCMRMQASQQHCWIGCCSWLHFDYYYTEGVLRDPLLMTLIWLLIHIKVN